MQFRFSPKVTATCGILIALMLRASYWQYQRHQTKLVYIATLGRHLDQPIAPIETVISSVPDSSSEALWEPALHRRVTVRGEYDFEHEMILRNRRYDGFPGAFAITPLKIDGTDYHILVSRGFIPLSTSTKDKRKAYQKESHAEFTGLIKEPVKHRFLAPSDPEAGKELPWVDAWLRVDTENIQKQLPYPILPVFLEIMETANVKGAEDKIVSSKSGRDEMFFLPGRENGVRSDDQVPNLNYPVPIFDAVVPPGRHEGYIYEWALMAFVTFLIGVVLQMKRPTKQYQ